MKKLNWRVKLGIGLVLLSAALYFVHWLIYRDPHHIFIYLIGDIAFIPIEVLLLTLIIHEALAAREKRALLEKLNMVIGSFYSEVGTELLRLLSSFDPQVDGLRQQLVPTNDWAAQEFAQVRAALRRYDCAPEPGRGDLQALRGFLVGKRGFLLGLLQNPNLLEHDAFTHLLWAVLHLTEELACRRDLAQLPDTDLKHLGGDIKRAYTLLLAEWADYMKHLKAAYPYLFSLAMRTNPFDPAATPEVA
ncbi:MAG TPA: hypothetical protein VNE39_18175 [Planctomycetota bacterium]|nr:hypothetical protein [Planctomycetota bacterium]